MSYDISIFKATKKLSTSELLKTMGLIDQQADLQRKRDSLQISQNDFSTANTSLKLKLEQLLEPRENFKPFLDSLDTWLSSENTNRDEFLREYDINENWAYIHAEVDLSEVELSQLSRLAERQRVQVFSHATGEFAYQKDFREGYETKGCMKPVAGCFGTVQLLLVTLIFLSPLALGLVDLIFGEDDSTLWQVFFLIGIPLAILFVVALFKGWLKYLTSGEIFVTLVDAITKNF